MWNAIKNIVSTPDRIFGPGTDDDSSSEQLHNNQAADEAQDEDATLIASQLHTDLDDSKSSMAQTVQPIVINRIEQLSRNALFLQHPPSAEKFKRSQQFELIICDNSLELSFFYARYDTTISGFFNFQAKILGAMLPSCLGQYFYLIIDKRLPIAAELLDKNILRKFVIRNFATSTNLHNFKDPEFSYPDVTFSNVLVYACQELGSIAEWTQEEITAPQYNASSQGSTASENGEDSEDCVVFRNGQRFDLEQDPQLDNEFYINELRETHSSPSQSQVRRFTSNDRVYITFCKPTPSAELPELNQEKGQLFKSLLRHLPAKYNDKAESYGVHRMLQQNIYHISETKAGLITCKELDKEDGKASNLNLVALVQKVFVERNQKQMHVCDDLDDREVQLHKYTMADCDQVFPGSIMMARNLCFQTNNKSIRISSEVRFLPLYAPSDALQEMVAYDEMIKIAELACGHADEMVAGCDLPRLGCAEPWHRQQANYGSIAGLFLGRKDSLRINDLVFVLVVSDSLPQSKINKTSLEILKTLINRKCEMASDPNDLSLINHLKANDHQLLLWLCELGYIKLFSLYDEHRACLDDAVEMETLLLFYNVHVKLDRFELQSENCALYNMHSNKSTKQLTVKRSQAVSFDNVIGGRFQHQLEALVQKVRRLKQEATNVDEQWMDGMQNDDELVHLTNELADLTNELSDLTTAIENNKHKENVSTAPKETKTYKRMRRDCLQEEVDAGEELGLKKVRNSNNSQRRLIDFGPSPDSNVTWVNNFQQIVDSPDGIYGVPAELIVSSFNSQNGQEITTMAEFCNSFVLCSCFNTGCAYLKSYRKLSPQLRRVAELESFVCEECQSALRLDIVMPLVIMDQDGKKLEVLLCSGELSKVTRCSAQDILDSIITASYADKTGNKLFTSIQRFLEQLCRSDFNGGHARYRWITQKSQVMRNDLFWFATNQAWFDGNTNDQQVAWFRIKHIVPND